MENTLLTGTVRLDFDTDGDFGFSDFEGIEKEGWEVYYDDNSANYAFTIEDFTGTTKELYYKIIHGLFMHIHTSRVYVMENLCGVFRSLESHLNALKLEAEFYEDMGNQEVSATFNLKPANKKQELEQEIEIKTRNLNYSKSLVESYQRQTDELEKTINLLKKELEDL